MKLTGNILNVKNKRDDRHAGITLEIDKIEYITHKKDGKYYQPFDLMVELDEPVTLTGDCLARKEDKNLPEGEYDFLVYDKEGDDYVLNENKFLSVLLVYDDEEHEHILSSVEYTITVPNDEFKVLKEEQHKLRASKKGIGRKKR
ncbi:hypothetical protein H9Q13_00995 [Pontibacter sp. JH31]|uniref:Uncharacterized protein n=1 Tax=Pontibacter aquaedesilientis TaxID=2766980 RepID=A0ABR7XDP4_9BACT|nr:hypothetical protein [Pontibacter aquaedesilientis]MBD1395728.1 hypothetical protein [Pontibacter aquaedesilientis]